MDELNGKATPAAASASAAAETTATTGNPGTGKRGPGRSGFSDAGDRLLCAVFTVVSLCGMLYLAELAAACAGLELFHAR